MLDVPSKAFAYSRAESTSAAPASAEAPFSATPIKAEPVLPLFTTLADKISPETLRAITVKPFQLTRMSPVQAEVLPLLPELAEPYDPNPPPDGQQRPPRDLLVRAKTGTGKTLAFLVPAIEARIKAIRHHVQQALKDSGLNNDKHLADRAQKAFVRSSVGTLIISPTRELATQIANEALRLTHHHDDFEVRLFTGGTSKRMQMRDWMKGRRDIVVATPGRLRDLLTSEPEVVRGLSKTQTVCFFFSPWFLFSNVLLSCSSFWTKLIRYWTWVSVRTSRPSSNSYLQSQSVRLSSSQRQSQKVSKKLLAPRLHETTNSSIVSRMSRRQFMPTSINITPSYLLLDTRFPTRSVYSRTIS